jgi:hypothetical protein
MFVFGICYPSHAGFCDAFAPFGALRISPASRGSRAAISPPSLIAVIYGSMFGESIGAVKVDPFGPAS